MKTLLILSLIFQQVAPCVCADAPSIGGFVTPCRTAPSPRRCVATRKLAGRAGRQIVAPAAVNNVCCGARSRCAPATVAASCCGDAGPTVSEMDSRRRTETMRSAAAVETESRGNDRCRLCESCACCSDESARPVYPPSGSGRDRTTIEPKQAPPTTAPLSALAAACQVPSAAAAPHVAATSHSGRQSLLCVWID